MPENLTRYEIFARATVFARNLACTRATPATPCYMEARVRELCALFPHSGIKELRVVKGQ
jgi:hypothetical protein